MLAVRLAVKPTRRPTRFANLLCAEHRCGEVVEMPLTKKQILALLILQNVKSGKTGGKIKKKKRFWMKKWLQKRDKFSDVNLLNELKVSSPDDYKNYLRMDEPAFKKLLEMVRPYISKQDTKFRQAVSAEARLIATLRYLATGRSFECLKFSARISPQLLGKIIPETCEAIYRVLRKEYMNFPSTENEWLEIAKGFETKCNFPNCGGAIDGKHIRIKCPPNSGSYFYNYKQYFSIVSMAVVNANYEFVYVNVGANGRMSDGGVIEQTSFHEKLISKTLHIPRARNTVENLNFVFIADDAFGLHENVLKPFPQSHLTRAQRIFNYRLSRARRMVENVFGILTSRFRIFSTEINLTPETIDKVVLACCALHNFLRRESANYVTPASVDKENTATGEFVHGEWRNEPQIMHGLQSTTSKKSTNDAKQSRNEYMNYFNTIGAVPWQDKMI